MVKMVGKKYIFVSMFIWLFGCNSSQPNMQQFELAENKVVNTGNEYTKVLYEERLLTKNYKTLRVFAHIFNEAYKENPIPQNASFSISAFYGIGQGSWGYFSKTFYYKSTSGWDGLVDIPIIGETTRISIYSKSMQHTTLKVDVVGVLLSN